ncbi:MAG: hypothetical protein IPP37_20420 [Saprospiraceae bacterium]|nr:hypothetical protein [Saprospiraceae bacterium]
MTLEHLKPNTVYYLQVASKRTQTGYLRGQLCVEIKDIKPDYEKINLSITQECRAMALLSYYLRYWSKTHLTPTTVLALRRQ